MQITQATQLFQRTEEHCLKWLAVALLLFADICKQIMMSSLDHTNFQSIIQSWRGVMQGKMDDLIYKMVLIKKNNSNLISSSIQYALKYSFNFPFMKTIV